MGKPPLTVYQGVHDCVHDCVYLYNIGNCCTVQGRFGVSGSCAVHGVLHAALRAHDKKKLVMRKRFFPQCFEDDHGDQIVTLLTRCSPSPDEK